MDVLLGILLAICLLMLATVLGHLVAMRRRLVRQNDVFRCKVRVTSGAVPDLSPWWSLRARRAEWKHDVLLMYCGPWLTCVHPLPVRFAEGVIEPALPISRLRMGSDAVMLRLRLDDGTLIAVAAPAQTWESLAGPFLAVAAQGMSSDISPRRR